MNIDKILFNGNIITMRHESERMEAIAISGDKIVAVGKNSEILNFKSDNSELINLDRKTVLPGFFDSHLHLVSTILSNIAINCFEAESISEILELIEAKKNDMGNMPLIYGKGISDFTLKEKRFPTRREIDLVAPNVPVILSSIEFHTVIVNSYAMHLFNIPFTTNSFEKDSQNRFTGKISNRGSYIARKKMFEMISDKIYIDNLDKTMSQIIKKGITTAVTVEGGSLFHDNHAEFILNNKDVFPIDVELFYSTTNTSKILGAGLPRIGGDIFLDGSFRSQNAALYNPYSDNKNSTGFLFFNRDELFEFISQSDNLRLQIAIHAVGPRAIDMLLDCYEQAMRENNTSNQRHRIEHFELPTDKQILRAKELNLVLAMHPTYELYFRGKGDMYDTRIGYERSILTNPLKDIIDKDITVAGCSDSDVLPIDTMLGIYAATNHINERSRISTYEALKMYTINGAYGIFQENIKGTIDKNKLADIVVLSSDPIVIKKEYLKDIKVLLTMKSGKILHNSLGGLRYD